jgi:hypothetical protein
MPYPVAAVRAKAGGAAGEQFVVRDRFGRADSALTLGSAETGQAWTAQQGTWGISSNQAYVAALGAGLPQVATIDSGLTEYTLRCKLYPPPARGPCMPSCVTLP